LRAIVTFLRSLRELLSAGGRETRMSAQAEAIRIFLFAGLLRRLRFSRSPS